MKTMLLLYILSFTMASCNPAIKQDKKKQTKSQTILNEFGTLNPNAPKESKQFGQFVGEWDCKVMNLGQDSIWKESIASWKFKYILEGYAIQDYWQNPEKADTLSANFLLGSNLRIYNPVLKKWQCVWIENKKNTMNGIWEATVNSDKEIIMKDSTNNWEIKFYNISEDYFDWKWDFKQPSGEMKTMSKIVAKRKV